MFTMCQSKCVDLNMLPGGWKRLSFECTWHVLCIQPQAESIYDTKRIIANITIIMAWSHYFPDHYHSPTPIWLKPMTNEYKLNEYKYNDASIYMELNTASWLGIVGLNTKTMFLLAVQFLSFILPVIEFENAFKGKWKKHIEMFEKSYCIRVFYCSIMAI